MSIIHFIYEKFYTWVMYEIKKLYDRLKNRLNNRADMYIRSKIKE